jgi:hypothetical protein
MAGNNINMITTNFGFNLCISKSRLKCFLQYVQAYTHTSETLTDSCFNQGLLLESLFYTIWPHFPTTTRILSL